MFLRVFYRKQSGRIYQGKQEKNVFGYGNG